MDIQELRRRSAALFRELERADSTLEGFVPSTASERVSPIHHASRADIGVVFKTRVPGKRGKPCGGYGNSGTQVASMTRADRPGNRP